MIRPAQLFLPVVALAAACLDAQCYSIDGPTGARGDGGRDTCGDTGAEDCAGGVIDAGSQHDTGGTSHSDIGTHFDTGTTPDQGIPDDAVASVDTGSPDDAGTADDTGFDAAVPDAGTVTDAGAPDTGASEDVGVTECGVCPKPLCGLQLDPCNDILDCGSCPDVSETCVFSPKPLFKNAVHGAIEQLKTEHPEWFDLNDAQGDSVHILEPDAYHNGVVAILVGQGLVAIVDPNDNYEVRVRNQGSDQAENIRIHTSWDHTAYKYNSTCAPAGF